MAQSQNFKNHGRLVPMYLGVFLIFIVNLFWAISQLTRGVSGEAVMDLLLAIALKQLFFSIRPMVLTVQDRLIRLEMRLRLREVLPADLHPKIPTLTVDQLIGLRFAGDAELTDLVREVLAGRLVTRREIKRQVKDWQPDYLRA